MYCFFKYSVVDREAKEVYSHSNKHVPTQHTKCYKMECTYMYLLHAYTYVHIFMAYTLS